VPQVGQRLPEDCDRLPKAGDGYFNDQDFW
jgi:hypothetical protein